MRRRLLVGISLTLLNGCGGDQVFEALPQAAKVSIETDYQSDSLPTITDSVRIAEITAFVNARRSDWGTLGFGVPIPRISAKFYEHANDRTPLAHFGAGPGFFESSHYIGDFAAKRATKDEIREFLRLIGAPPDAADPPRR
jgi:hypothetical protein